MTCEWQFSTRLYLKSGLKRVLLYVQLINWVVSLLWFSLTLLIHDALVVSLPCSCLWVAVLEEKMVGVVAAVGSVVLHQMAVDQRWFGISLAQGQKVLEFTVVHTHKLCQRTGFCCVWVTGTAPFSRKSFSRNFFSRKIL